LEFDYSRQVYVKEQGFTAEPLN